MLKALPVPAHPHMGPTWEQQGGGWRGAARHALRLPQQAGPPMPVSSHSCHCMRSAALHGLLGFALVPYYMRPALHPMRPGAAFQ